MNKLFLIFLIFIRVLAIKWDSITTVILSKDDAVYYNVSSKIYGSKELSLRWTLYVPNQLTLFVKYDSHPMQFVLNQNDINRNFIKLNLNPNDDRKYILIKFDNFREDNATFKLFVNGQNSVIIKKKIVVKNSNR